jgi:hypothetical protein
METITINPNGVNLNTVKSLGETLIMLAEELRYCYDDAHRYDYAKHILRRVNINALMLGLPEIEINFDFIDKARNLNSQLK